MKSLRENGGKSAKPSRRALFCDRLPVLVLVFVFAVAARARANDVYTLNTSESSKSYGAFSDAYYWNDADDNRGTSGASLDSLGDYVVPSSGANKLRMPSGTATFGGRTLTISSGAYLYAYTGVLTVPQGLTLAGYFRQPGADATTTVASTVTISGTAAQIFGEGTGATFVFNAPLATASSKDSVQLGVNSGSNLTVRLCADCPDYAGSITVYKPKTVTAFGDHNRLQLGAVSVPGTVTFNAFTELDVLSAQDVATIGTMTLSGAFRLKLPGTSGRCGRIVVTTAFAASKTPVELIVEGDPRAFSGQEEVFPLLTVPLNSALSERYFVLKTGFEAATPSALRVVADEDAGTQTLFLVTAPAVRLVTGDQSSQNNNYYVSALTNAAQWTVSPFPDDMSSVDFVVSAVSAASEDSVTVRTPELPEFSFAGKSLTIGMNCRLNLFVTGKGGGEFDANSLRVLDGGAVFAPKNSSSTRLLAPLEVPSGTVRIGTYRNQTMTVAGAISGSADLDVGGLWIASAGNAAGTVVLSGDNTSFTGKIAVRTDYRYSGYTPTYGHDVQTLKVASAAALGGARDELTPDAISLADYAVLAATASFALPPSSNRGLMTKDNGVIDVAADASFDLGTLLTVSGTAYKDGEGTLTLSGSAVADETSGGVLVVTNGTLAIATSADLGGLRIMMCAGTKLKLVVDPARESTGARLAAGVPFALDPSFGGTLPLSIECPIDLKADGKTTYTFGLLTVKAERLEDVRKLMPETAPKVASGFRSSWGEPVDNGDGTMTIVLVAERSGLVLFFK